VLAVADRASSIAPIGVQLVKDVPRLRGGTGWPDRGATAATAANRTMANVMFGVITFFITHFLSHGLRSTQAGVRPGPEVFAY